MNKKEYFIAVHGEYMRNADDSQIRDLWELQERMTFIFNAIYKKPFKQKEVYAARSEKN